MPVIYKTTILINLIPQVSVWITVMCGWPQNKLKYLFHGIDLRAGQHGRWIYFLTPELIQKTVGEELFRLGGTQVRSWGRERKSPSHLIWSQSKRRCFILSYESPKKPFLFSSFNVFKWWGHFKWKKCHFESNLHFKYLQNINKPSPKWNSSFWKCQNDMHCYF